jgi:formylglycine-generating enzyme required for sulfatase activity
MEYHTSTSELFIMLEKGHYGVEMDRDSIRRLHTWADLNVPYFGTWIEVARRLNRTEQITNIAARATELRSLYAGVDHNPELAPYAHLEPLGKIEFIKPKEVQRDYSAPNIPNWPFDAATAKNMQTKPNKTIKVNNDLTIELAWIPAGKFVMGDDGGLADELPRSAIEIKKPFWMMTTEVTNALYRQFDPTHNSRFVDQWSKDHVHPGYPANKPEQPVIRINWNQANEFCQWLSEQTGKKFRLPTEAEWEWACRAGSATPMWYGNTNVDFGKLENMSDMQTRKFVVRGVDPQPINNPPPHQAFIPRAEGVDDGNMVAENVGAYQANPWGLFDMHGSVSEWTDSDYRPYPYIDTPNDPALRKVARGGSWRDRPTWSRSGIRRPYEAWQPVHNVGIRVVCEE